jgi:epsin
MEAKVREATNDDPWGASSTLMQEIAESTFNYAHFNEIMPVIYKRFTEKEASEWRQIYKALQLLEYIIKHGSERVVDDARSHLSMIKMLRNFHFIDDKGKDQGINVRNRSKELADLLSDLDKVRQERRKAKANRNKYKGVGNDSMSPSFTSSSGSRYGGFGSDAYREFVSLKLLRCIL